MKPTKKNLSIIYWNDNSILIARKSRSGILSFAMQYGWTDQTNRALRFRTINQAKSYCKDNYNIAL